MTSWMQTNTDRKHDLLCPHLSGAVNWREIAHALANLNRFTGHTKFPYSVAQHCCLAHDLASGPYKLHALLHDAHEAYTGDISTPMQEALATLQPGARTSLKLIQHMHDSWIFDAAGIAPDEQSHAEVKRADVTMLVTERKALLGPSPAPWGEIFENTPPTMFVSVKPWTRLRAYQGFLRRLKARGVNLDAALREQRVAA
jgi:hypothetical protein